MHQMFQIIPKSLKNSFIMQVVSPIPSDPLHSPYNARQREALAEYLGLIKMALQYCRSSKQSTQRPSE